MIMKQFAVFANKPQRGGMLAMMGTLGILMLAFMGVGIYLGVVTYLQQELEKAASGAALAGASSMYDGFNAAGEEVANGPAGRTAARMIVDTIIAEVPLLASSNATATITPAGNTMRVNMTADMEPPILSFIGITTIEINASATAKAIKYCPSQSQGSITLSPPGPGATASYTMDFAVNDLLPGAEIKINQENTLKGYTVEGCAGGSCHTLSNTDYATPLVTCRTTTNTLADNNVIYGSAVIDLVSRQVSKVASLQFRDDKVYDSFSAGCGNHSLDSGPTTIDSVEILGFSSLCFGGMCPTPTGFVDVTGGC